MVIMSFFIETGLSKSLEMLFLGNVKAYPIFP